MTLQMDWMVVVQGEASLVVMGQFSLRMKGGQTCGAGFLPGAGVLVAGNVEQVHGLAGQEEATLSSIGHAPHHRGHTAAAVQQVQHSTDMVFIGSHHGRQVVHAGQEHP